MATSADPERQRSAEPAAPATKGVVLVHGIGDQRQSDTLLDIGEPLFDWLARWHEASGAAGPRLGRAELHFSAQAEAAAVSNAVIHLPNGDCWVLMEGWWNASNRRPRFAEMAPWAARHPVQVGVALARSFRRRLDGCERDAASVGPVLRRLLALYTLATLIVYAIAALVGTPIALLLLFLAQLPIPALRSALLRALQPFIEINLGDFRTLLENEIEAGNIRQRLAGVVERLVADYGCAEVTIVAHSGGAVASFDLLTDPSRGELVAPVRKLITVGAGLNKAWLLAPRLARLRRQLPRHIHWVDLWASFDAVPVGWLTPPPDLDTPIFAPADEIVAAHGLAPRSDPNPFPLCREPADEDAPSGRYWPESVKVTNELSLLTDHGGYWSNDEEVLMRLAAEIDSDRHQDSRFWPGGAEAADAAVRRRRERVIALASLRALFVTAWFGTTVGSFRPLARLLRPYVARVPLPAWLRRFAAGREQGAVNSLVAALLPGLLFILAFRVVRFRWEWWDRRERAATLQRTVASRPALAGASPDVPSPVVPISVR